MEYQKHLLAPPGKKQNQKKLKTAIGNHIWDVLGKAKMDNKAMFALSPEGTPLSTSIVSYMDEAPSLKNPEEILKIEFEGHPLTKEVRTECVYDSNIELIDVKLDVYGPNEDMFYSTFPNLVKNVRRGNTIIKRYNEDKTHQFVMGRRGLMKFFDLRLPFISKEERNELSIKNYKEDLHQEKNYILAPVLKAIAEGSEVQVFKTLKANGENV